MAIFAPVGAKYKIQYYFPDLGLLGFEPSFSMVMEDKEYVVDRVVPIYPGIGEDFGEQIVDEHYQHFQAELLLQIADIWALERIPNLAKGDRVRWVIQCPVDFLDPIPDYVVSKMEPAIRVVPWVQESYERLQKYRLPNLSEPIPLGLNTDLWKPQERVNFSHTMADLGFAPDTYNIAIVAANQRGRKAWEQTIQAIKGFREKRPDASLRVYLHTHLLGADGWDISNLVNLYGIADITKTAKPYEMIIGAYSEYQMMLIHALADVVINCGLEGFGYSTIQSQACGTPVIGLDAGATRNLIESGILVPPYSEVLTPNFLRRVETHPLYIAEALERIYETPRSQFTKGIQFVRNNFSWPLVIEKWKKLLNEVNDEFERKCIKSVRYPPAPSERAQKMAQEAIVLG